MNVGRRILIGAGVLLLVVVVALGGFLLEDKTVSTGSSSNRALAAAANVASTCATASVPAQTIDANGTFVGLVAGASDTQCVTATGETQTVTVTAPAATTAPTTTTAPATTTAPTTTTTPSGGYTTAASVDTTRMPIPPSGNTSINITSPITVSGTVTDTTYNVTGNLGSGTAITLTATGKLQRVVVNVNGRASNGVSGPGTVQDVSVSGATYAGYANIAHYKGADYGSRSNIDFYLNGNGTTLDPDALLKSNDATHFGFLPINLSGAHMDGAIVAQNCGQTSRDASCTGVEFWDAVTSSSFNIIISNANPGYGLAIYRSSGNTVNEFYGDGSGTFDSDPGVSIGGGSHNNTITKATVKNYALGIAIGEDVDPSPYANTIHTVIVQNTAYPALRLDRGGYDNVFGDVGGFTATNTGSAGQVGTINIANRSGQTNTPPHGNQVLGLVESSGGGSNIPQYAVNLGDGTSGNVVHGTATSFSVARVKNDGTNTDIVVTG